MIPALPCGTFSDGNRQIKRLEVLAPGTTIKLENREGKSEVIQV